MLKVTTVAGNGHQVDAASWHVDETDGLHLRDERKNPVATFAAGKWISVEKLPSGPSARV